MTGLARSHPELARRYDLLVEHAAVRGWRIGITSSTRQRAQQEAMYADWIANGPPPPSVANPNNSHGSSPWDWVITGSYHMPQADGFSHALDINWDRPKVDAEDIEALANRCGLVQTVPNEDWHYQWFNRKTIFPVDPTLDQPIQSEDDDMGTTIHQPRDRGDGRTQDILRMPAFGATAGGSVVYSTVFIRQLPRPSITDATAVVYCNGSPQHVALPADGRTMPAWVTADGLVSVECDFPVWVEGHETWVKAA
jgi:hypothetical protein